jgi:hypothetical protein
MSEIQGSVIWNTIGAGCVRPRGRSSSNGTGGLAVLSCRRKAYSSVTSLGSALPAG